MEFWHSLISEAWKKKNQQKRCWGISHLHISCGGVRAGEDWWESWSEAGFLCDPIFHVIITSQRGEKAPNNQLSKITIVGPTFVRKQTSVCVCRSAWKRGQHPAETGSMFALTFPLPRPSDKCSWALLCWAFYCFLTQHWIITLQKQRNSLWCEGLIQHGWLFKSDYRRTSSARSSEHLQMLNQNKKTCVFTARFKLQGHPNMRSRSHVAFLQLRRLKGNHSEFPLWRRGGDTRHPVALFQGWGMQRKWV